ncbi:Cocaine esterase [Pigmentiphaga humi]|uniref:Cocaine esterase n=1 Tax=Pigmentiphaga humi TaxID=2478468 RepID=A0A3P4AXP4_9BURK|nr:CocE/NonD family hydrolase [Pigmentiphaga humi]VCU68833.1 Cocaine esterase [Pigmentiphaga humi]
MTDATPTPSLIVRIPARDGALLTAAVYLPPGAGRFPALFAASPYRFDNNRLPPTNMFMWSGETGPIAYYLSHGYAFVHMDVRGTGRSEGEYRYHDELEQTDLYDAIEWIAAQAWCTGKVGGIGQSYYARMQWFMGIQNPPSLACIAPYDGNIDTYRAAAYSGGIPGLFPVHWYNNSLRAINECPYEGEPRRIDWDFIGEIRAHPLYDEFWRIRAAAERLAEITVPVFSIGAWSKVDYHLNGNIVGYQRLRSPRKLLVLGGKDMFKALADFTSTAFHETYLRPFYDHYLKGERTGYLEQPEVRYFLSGADRMRSAEAWPPPQAGYRRLYLDAAHSGSVSSLNDGMLSEQPPAGASSATSYRYPDPQWRGGVVSMDEQGRLDPVRRTLTFTSAPLAADLEVTGPVRLVLFLSSSNSDTDVVVKLADQFPNDSAGQPVARVLTKGWLRASHRQLDDRLSRENAPWYTHADPEPLLPGQVYRLDIAIMPMAHVFKAGHRIRISIANGDAHATDFPYDHLYTPDKVGEDAIHHDKVHASHLVLPVMHG